MDAHELLDQIRNQFEHVVVAEASGNFFVFYRPNQVASEQRMPFVTVMVNDANDDCSRLQQSGAYRVNVGVSRQTFGMLFDPNGRFDFTAADQLMPHPVYASSSWVCVVNPGPTTLERLRGLVAEAYDVAVDRLKRRQNGGAP